MANKFGRSQALQDSFENAVASANSVEAIDAFLDLAPRTPLYTYIRQSIVFSRENLFDVLLSKSVEGEFFVKPLNDSFAVKIEHTVGDPPQKIEGIVAILPSNEENIYRLTTISKTPFWGRSVRKLLRNIYPYGMPVFFRQNEIRDALLNFEREMGDGYKIRISEAVLKAERDDGSFQGRRIFDTHRYWTDLSIAEIFSRARENGEWFTSLGFHIDQEVRQTQRYRNIFKGRLYKSGSLYFDFLYSDISRILLPPLEQFAVERLGLLDNRGIRERQYVAGPPLAIEYQKDVFSDLHEVHRFGDTIKKYPYSTKAVYHANPYYHANIADSKDGSSVEIWVLSPRRVLLVPQAKTTEHALERLIGHIFLDFREGELYEFEQ